MGEPHRAPGEGRRLRGHVPDAGRGLPLRPVVSSDEEWIAGLPATVAECAERWGLVLGKRLSGGLVAHVFGCTTRSGDAAVLKLSPPSAAAYAGTPEQEAAALRAWAGRGAVELLEFAPELSALLTRRAVPGTPLADHNEEEALREAGSLLCGLLEAPVPAVALPPLSEAADRYLDAKLTAAKQPMAPLVEQARAAARELARSAADEALLHGDLMDKNLLRHERGFVAIDPMPCVGDPHSDLGFWAATRSPVETLEPRARALARIVGLDPKRSERWAAVYAVGQSCEGWRDDVGELREWTRSERARELLGG